MFNNKHTSLVATIVTRNESWLYRTHVIHASETRFAIPVAVTVSFALAAVIGVRTAISVISCRAHQCNLWRVFRKLQNTGLSLFLRRDFRLLHPTSPPGRKGGKKKYIKIYFFNFGFFLFCDFITLLS